MDIKSQIFKELDALEAGATKLRATAQTAGKQTDLEVAILTEQVKDLRRKNAAAGELVDKSLEILRKI